MLFSQKKRAWLGSAPQAVAIVLTSVLALRLAAPLLSFAAHRSGLPAVNLDFSQAADADGLRSAHARLAREAVLHRRRHHHHNGDGIVNGGSREARLASVIYGMQPRKGHGYAERVARLVMASARREHLRPEVIAATATVESHFDMRSGPCIGIMQMNPRTIRARHSEAGLDPDSIGGNLRLGASELARHYDEAEHLGRRSERARLAVMWGRYNGAGPNSGYVRRCMAAYRQILRSEG